MNSSAKFCIVMSYLIMAFGLGVVCGSPASVNKATIDYRVEYRPVYSPMKKGKHFTEQRDLIAAAIPATALRGQ